MLSLKFEERQWAESSDYAACTGLGGSIIATLAKKMVKRQSYRSQFSVHRWEGDGFKDEILPVDELTGHSPMDRKSKSAIRYKV